MSAHHNGSICAGISDAFLRASGVTVCPPDSPYLLHIPYRDLDGRLTGFARQRLRVPVGSQKYTQPPGSGSHPYLIPNPNRVATDMALCVEGEKKAIAAAEDGRAVIGLPGLYCYTKDETEPDLPPILLPGIIECLERCQARRIVFIGDTDALVNLAYYRSAAVLANSVPPGIEVSILPLPLGGPKGLDDVRGEHGPDAFGPWLDAQLEDAFLIARNQAFVSVAARLLELRGDSFAALSAIELERYQHKLIRMAAEAEMSKDASAFDVMRLHKQIQPLLGCTKPEFASFIKEAVTSLRKDAGDEEVEKALERVAFYDSIAPAEEEEPLSTAVRRMVRTILTFIGTDDRLALISALWAVFTHFYTRSFYLPLLLYTGIEKNTGKSNFMRLVAKMSLRAISILPTGAIHRITAVYAGGTYVIDETPDLAENVSLRSFINSGYDAISEHPVDRPMLTKFCVDSGELEEFESRFPKAFAGIGTYLQEDTISRSIVIPTERYTHEEGVKLLPYPLYDETYWLPIYRALLRYATDERKEEFRSTCMEIIQTPPLGILERLRDVYSPLLALARMAGDGLEQDLLAALEWYFTLERSTDKIPAARLCLRDVARVLYRQIALHQRREAGLPAGGEEPRVHHQPTTGVYILASPDLTPLLHALPESAWNKFGPGRMPITENEVWALLRVYKIRSGHIKVSGKAQRGLVYDPRPKAASIKEAGFCEAYSRYREQGYPTLEKAAQDLQKEFDKDMEGPGA